MPGVACRSDLAKRLRTQKVVRQVKVWMIEEIEHLTTQLQINILRKIRVLYQRSIDALIAWSIDNVPAGVSECTRRGESKRGGIKPSFRCAVCQPRIPNKIRPVICAKTQGGKSSTAVVEFADQSNRERTSGLCGHDAGGLPAIQQSGPAAAIVQVLTAFAKRQVVNITNREPVAHVKV